MIKLQELKPKFKAPRHENLRELLRYATKEYGSDTAFIVKHKNGKEVSYEHISFEAFWNRVNQLGTALLKRGMKGKRIATVSKNRAEWMESHFAALAGLGYSVPLDNGLPYEELESSLARSYADVLVFEAAQIADIERLKAEGKTQVQEYICMDELEGYLSIPQLRDEGEKLLGEGFDEYLSLPIDKFENQIILFTSGTTSLSKAVLLSHYNLVENIYGLQLAEDIHRGDVNMAFLPYHHTFGSTGQTLMLACGVTTTYCDGLKYLQKNIVEYKVSVFFCVPLLIESIYKKVMATVKKEGKENTVKFGIALSKFLLKFGIDIRRKVFKTILDQLGGNLRFVISGAAAIDPEAIEGFNNFGIRAVQGYGMTEAAPVITAENHWERKAGSIGRALPGVEVAIDEPDENGVGEIICRGPNVMAGYYENEEDTAKTLIDGWLHTGDLGYIDEDGFLFICGRKKNVIVLKNGKNVYPEEIEVLIAALPYVSENFIFGKPRREDDEKALALWAKIVYNPEYMKEHYGASTPAEAEEVIRRDIDAINDTLPVYKQIFKLVVTDQEMIKTTTGKVKRYEETKNL